MKKTAGKWDRTWPIYFVVANIDHVGIFTCPNVLVSIYDCNDDQIIDLAARKDIKNLFIDSGVFGLSARHAERHGISIDQAFTTAPKHIDGYDALFERYVRLMHKIGSKVWGYVEIDQGGRAQKVKTRRRLEKLGLRPIPVYHPLSDPWDYFDELAKNYDRICVGNFANSDTHSRLRLAATIWERRRKYPHLWVHLLGLGPSELTVAFPGNSCDSSAWVNAIRYGYIRLHSVTGSFDRLGLEWAYEYQEEKSANGTGWSESYTQGIAMCGYDAAMLGRSVERIAADQRRELGCNLRG